MTATRWQYGDERLGGVRGGMRSCLLVTWISMTLLGCARTPGHWVGDPGVSQAQMDRDVYDCKRDATRYQAGIGFGGFQTPGTNLFMGGRMPGYYNVDSDVYAECMRVHGYRWVTAEQREAERHVAQERQRREKYARASALCTKYANLSGEYARGPIYTRCMEVEGMRGFPFSREGMEGSPQPDRVATFSSRCFSPDWQRLEWHRGIEPIQRIKGSGCSGRRNVA